MPTASPLITLGPMEPARLLSPLDRRPVLADLALAGALALLAIVTGLALVAPDATVRPPAAPVLVLWAIALAAPLALRRRFPLSVLVVTTLHFPFYWASGQVNEIASWIVLGTAVYSAAAYGRRPAATVVASVCLALIATVTVLAFGLMLRAGAAQAVAAVLFNTMPFLVAWPLGDLTRRLRRTRETLEERNRQLAEEREANARQAVLS
jgi:hypothetical protein